MTNKAKLTPCTMTSNAYLTEQDGHVESVTLTQNLAVKGHDHWLLDASLTRWRPKKKLVAYLMTLARLVDEATQDGNPEEDKR